MKHIFYISTMAVITLHIFCAREEEPRQLGPFVSSDTIQRLLMKGKQGTIEGIAVGLTLTPIFFWSNQLIRSTEGEHAFDLTGQPLTTQIQRRWSGFKQMVLGKMLTTAAQEMINIGGMDILRDSQLTENQQRMGMAIVAGFISSAIPNTTEMYACYKQMHIKVPIEQALVVFKRSYLSAAWREMLFSVAHLHGAEKLKKVLQEHTSLGSAPCMITAGVASGILAALLSQPGHVIKTLIQKDIASIKYHSTWQTLLLMLKEESFTALFKGWPARVVAVPIATTAILASRALMNPT